MECRMMSGNLQEVHMEQYPTANLYHLSFQQILTFFSVIECGSFTKAAMQLNMSQAAVSRTIANIEWETQLILFVRKVNGALPTPAAKVLYKEWKEVFRGFKAGYLNAYRVQQGYIRDLNIGSIDMEQNINHHIKMLDWFESVYKDNEIKFHYDRTEALREGLLSGKFDLIFTNGFEKEYLEFLGARCKLISPKPCKLFLHESHPLYEKENLDVKKDLHGQKMIFFGTREITSSKQVQDFCKEYGISQRQMQFESDYKNAMIDFRRKTGIFFSEGIFEEGQLGTARAVPLEGISSGLLVAWMDKKLNMMVKNIENYVKEIYTK